MARKRKTVKLEHLKKRINNMILNSQDDQKNGRSWAGLFLEEILIDAGCYDGFRCLTKTDMQKSENGVSRGINEGEGFLGSRFDDTDETRVEYY